MISDHYFPSYHRSGTIDDSQYINRSCTISDEDTDCRWRMHLHKIIDTTIARSILRHQSFFSGQRGPIHSLVNTESEPRGSLRLTISPASINTAVEKMQFYLVPFKPSFSTNIHKVCWRLRYTEDIVLSHRNGDILWKIPKKNCREI